MRDSLLLYRTHLDALLSLPSDDLKESLRAIRDYALDDIEPAPEGIGYAILQMVKPIIDKNNKRAANRIRYKTEQTGTSGNKQEQSGTSMNKPEQTGHIKGKGEKVKGKEEIKNIGRFTPPTAHEVREYVRESGHNIDVDTFIDFYESKGWMVGKNKMKDWKAAVRNWSRSGSRRQGEATKGTKFSYEGRKDIDFDALERAVLRK